MCVNPLLLSRECFLQYPLLSLQFSWKHYPSLRKLVTYFPSKQVCFPKRKNYKKMRRLNKVVMMKNSNGRLLDIWTHMFTNTKPSFHPDATLNLFFNPARGRPSAFQFFCSLALLTSFVSIDRGWQVLYENSRWVWTRSFIKMICPHTSSYCISCFVGIFEFHD